MDYENWKYINDWKSLRKLVKHCKQTGYACYDYETNAEPVHTDSFYPTILGVSFQIGSAYILPLAHFDSPNKHRWKAMLKYFLKEIIADPKVVKIAWNLKFEYKICLKYGVSPKGILLDGMLGKYLLDENSENGLKAVVRRLLPEYAGYEENYEGSHLPWAQRPLEGLSIYCALDCDLAFRLTMHIETKLKSNGLYSVFRNMMMMGTRVLAESEVEGMKIDRKYLLETHAKYQELLDALDHNLTNHATVLRYHRKRIQESKREFIRSAKEEIQDLEHEAAELDSKGDSTAANRKRRSITNRMDKIARVVNNQPSSKNEHKIFEPVNFKSPNQIIDLFFISPFGFQFPVIKYTQDKNTKKDTERPSTDEEVLLTLKQKDETGFMDLLLEHRAKSKLFSTYVNGILEKLSDNDTIHTRYLLHGTVTGRLSSRDPNLQNIPRDTTASDIKTMFNCPRGKVMMQLDYSQAELRVLAAAAEEESMIHSFNVGHDIHLASACKKFGVSYEEIEPIYADEDHPEYKTWKIRRKQAKTINFGIVYGQGAPALAGTLSDPDNGVVVSKEEAQGFLDDFDKTFPKIAKHIKNQHKLLKKHGYVKSVFGRKRRLPGIFSHEFGIKAKAMRDAVNAPIQGAASDYTLFSSILIRREILLGNIPKSVKQCYTVHDSLGFYMPPEVLDKCIPVMYEICKNPRTKEFFGFQIDSVEMKVDFEVGSIWSKLKGYTEGGNYSKLLEPDTID